MIEPERSDGRVRKTDDDFRYIGLTEDQIAVLAEYDDEARWIVYEEQIALLMQTAPTGGHQ